MPPNKKTFYPKWTYVKVNEDYYLILSKTKKKFISELAFCSWEINFIEATPESVSGYPLAGTIGYRPGSILLDMSYNFYWVEDDCIRRIADPKFFSTLGFSEQTAWRVSDKEIRQHKIGDPISID